MGPVLEGESSNPVVGCPACGIIAGGHGRLTCTTLVTCFGGEFGQYGFGLVGDGVVGVVDVFGDRDRNFLQCA